MYAEKVRVYTHIRTFTYTNKLMGSKFSKIVYCFNINYFLTYFKGITMISYLTVSLPVYTVS